jgi:hypothetical protein
MDRSQWIMTIGIQQSDSETFDLQMKDKPGGGLLSIEGFNKAALLQLFQICNIDKATRLKTFSVRISRTLELRSRQSESL